MKSKLIIITPLFKPAVGGASTYYDLLTKEFLKRKVFDKIIIITEKHPNAPNKETINELEIRRIFPFRAGSNFRNFKAYMKYAFQNLLYLKFIRILKTEKPTHLMVHSSFYIWFNLLKFLTYHIQAGITILDVRDKYLKKNTIKQIERYDFIIACSQNVKSHLLEKITTKKEIHLIPVIQEKLNTSRISGITIRTDFDFEEQNYFSSIGVIKEEKGSDVLLDVFNELIKNEDFQDFKLVLAGNIKDKTLANRIKNSENVIYMGTLKREDCLYILKHSSFNICLSKSEGLPRNCLESLSLNIPTLLPKEIPEFQKFCPLHVVQDDNPIKIANQIKNLYQKKSISSYPIDQHFPEKVIKKYFEVLNISSQVDS